MSNQDRGLRHEGCAADRIDHAMGVESAGAIWHADTELNQWERIPIVDDGNRRGSARPYNKNSACVIAVGPSHGTSRTIVFRAHGRKRCKYSPRRIQLRWPSYVDKGQDEQQTDPCDLERKGNERPQRA